MVRATLDDLDLTTALLIVLFLQLNIFYLYFVSFRLFWVVQVLFDPLMEQLHPPQFLTGSKLHITGWGAKRTHNSSPLSCQPSACPSYRGQRGTGQVTLWHCFMFCVCLCLQPVHLQCTHNALEWHHYCYLCSVSPLIWKPLPPYWVNHFYGQTRPFLTGRVSHMTSIKVIMCFTCWGPGWRQKASKLKQQYLTFLC